MRSLMLKWTIHHVQLIQPVQVGMSVRVVDKLMPIDDVITRNNNVCGDLLQPIYCPVYDNSLTKGCDNIDHATVE